MGAPDPLAKIGNPDLDGMLRKRGKNFNTWKTRYVLVKGIHLYIMKTPKVRFFCPPNHIASI